MQALTLSQAAVEAQIDGGTAVVRGALSILVMKRAERGDIHAPAEEPYRQRVALADEGGPAEDHP